MRLRIVRWIEHLLALFETGGVGDDALARLIVFLRAYEAGQRTDAQLAALHDTIFNKWFALSQDNPVGMSVRADIAYAAELATRPIIAPEMMQNAAIALAGAYCKAKSPLVKEIGDDGTASVRGWEHVHFMMEWVWQQANG